jgi:hypothetical protein
MLDTTGDVSLCAVWKEQLLQLLRAAVENKPTPLFAPAQDGPDINIFVDASLTGRGVVVFGLPEVCASGVQWTNAGLSSRDMNVLESATVLEGLTFFYHKATEMQIHRIRSITVHIDNTSALACALFRCKSESLRRIAPSLQHALSVITTTWSIIPKFVWVSTTKNLADPISRGFPLQAMPGYQRAMETSAVGESYHYAGG